MTKPKRETVVITITLKQDAINKIDDLASEFELKPSRLAGNLIDVGMEEFRVAKQGGFLKAGAIVWNVLKQYTKLFMKKEGKREPRQVNIAIRITKELNEEIDKYVSEIEVTRNQLIERCIDMALENFQFMQDIGIFKPTLAMVKLEEEIKELWDNRIKEVWDKRFEEAKNIGDNVFVLK